MKQLAVYTFGRFNPMTTGHEKLINNVIAIAAQNNGSAFIYTSSSFDTKKNPLKFVQKVFWLKKAFPKANISADRKINNPFQAAESLAKTHKDIILVVGGDRVKEMEKKLQTWFAREYPHHTIKVMNAGARSAMQIDGEDVSGSFMRKYATENNFDKFAKGVVSSLNNSDKKKLFTQVRAGMGLK